MEMVIATKVGCKPCQNWIFDETIFKRIQNSFTLLKMRLQATKGCSTMRFFKIALVDKTLTQFLILFFSNSFASKSKVSRANG